MSDIAGIEFVSSSAGSSTTTDHGGIDYLFPEEFLAIIESLIIKKVSEKFNGGLCSFFF